jgi:transposase
MSNVLDGDKQQQILALGRLGWTLRRVQQATGVRRETVSAYLKAAGIPVRGRGRPGTGPPKPAITGEVSTDPGRLETPRPGRAPSASACELHREFIVEALKLGRNAVAIWQDLVTDHGFTARYASVRRFVSKLRGSMPSEGKRSRIGVLPVGPLIGYQ